MRKIPTLFKRDFTNNGQIIPEYADGTDWVVNGDGVATRKYDGTSVLIRDHKMYKRYELKGDRVAPPNFEPVDKDETTGKTMGWVPVGWGNEDRWHREAIPSLAKDPDNVSLDDGTYELVGPKVQGNPEGTDTHQLIAHSAAKQYFDVPTDFDGLRAWLEDKDIEGLVWHHPDGRMVKIKKKDYRLKREAAA